MDRYALSGQPDLFIKTFSLPGYRDRDNLWIDHPDLVLEYQAADCRTQPDRGAGQAGTGTAAQ